jgi:hypothetical protein
MIIAQLNDAFSRSFTGGKVVVAFGIRALPADAQAVIIGCLRSRRSTLGYGEHAFGSFDRGRRSSGRSTCTIATASGIRSRRPIWRRPIAS